MDVRVPDIYIIGAQKSGTTTLYDWLVQHPEVYGHPLAKDYPYFSDDLTYADGYDRFFSFARKASNSQVVLGGDANAMYASAGPQRMSETIPSARLIAILRNPVDRAFSAYCYATERLLENRSLERAIRDELNGYEYGSADSLQRDYIAHGLYARQLKKIYQIFDHTQVKVVSFEDFIRNPLEILRSIFQFVGVSDDFVPEMKVKNRTRGGYRWRIVANITNRRPTSNVLRRLVKTLTPFSLRTNLRRKLMEINRTDSSKPELPEYVRSLLENYYREDLAELESIQGKKLFSVINSK
jgi:hypothetical protein